MSSGLAVYLVDDEPPALRRLERLLAEIPGCDLVGSTTEPQAALEDCARLAPDVVLLDVEMPGIDGVTLARRLVRQDPAPAIIFVTAFEQYAVDAFDLAAADYLVKPVRSERLAQALRRVRPVTASIERKPMLSARLADRIMNIPVADVRVLLAEDKYTSVHHRRGVALIEDSLVSLEERFKPRFLRIHRNALISSLHLRGLFRDENGQERVEVEDVDCRPEVSRRNLPGVRRLLKRAADRPETK